MGMYDTITCEYPLPHTEFQNFEFQTKDTPNQLCDYYKIDETGQLWVQDYDIEDRSDPNATGLNAIAGCMTRVNERWVKCDNTLIVHFYTSIGNYDVNSMYSNGWIEYRAEFFKGKLENLSVAVYDLPDNKRQTVIKDVMFYITLDPVNTSFIIKDLHKSILGSVAQSGRASD